jgi:aspartate racemase
MKRIGIVGGLSPESTLDYYRLLISMCRKRGMGHTYPVIIIYSVNFQECMDQMENGDSEGLTANLDHAIRSLYNAGANFALISANTPHIVFDSVAAHSLIPLLSIVVETGKVAQRLGLKKVGLFGTGVTMREKFYPETFSEKFGISIVVPEEKDQDFIRKSIISELAAGRIKETTRQKMVEIAEGMVEQDSIEGLILGCTELPLILSERFLNIPVLNTTKIHVEAALAYALGEK